MKTACIQIGNSDNKLTQQQWSNFCAQTYTVAEEFSSIIHFAGGAASNAPWQNYCIVAEIYPHLEEPLRTKLSELKEEFSQDSIALLVGTTRPV